LISLANASLRADIAPERGGEVRFLGRPGGDNVLASYDWATPLPAGRSASYGAPHLDWMSEYRGGWQVLFPNAGDGCEIEGIPIPFHGELSTASWDIVAQGAASLTITAGARLPLTLERRIRLGTEGALCVEEVVTNEGDQPVEFLWGHHPAFDAPPGTLIDLPPGAARRTGPKDEGDWPLSDLAAVGAGPVQSLCYLHDRPAAWAAVRVPARGRGVAMAWDLDAFPHLWLWHEVGGTGWPFHGRARLVAIEPQASALRDGLAAASERGEALRLEPGGRRESWLTMALFEATEAPVVGVSRDGTVSLGGHDAH
jgi:hypothetical protein